MANRVTAGSVETPLLTVLPHPAHPFRRLAGSAGMSSEVQHLMIAGDRAVSWVVFPPGGEWFVPVANEIGGCMRRFPVAIALVAALAVPSAAVVGLSGTAGAGNAVLGTSCAKLTGNAATTATISVCSPKLATYASASAKSTSLLNGGTLTWSTSKKTTVIAKPTLTSVTPVTCTVAGSSEEKAVGKITGGTATYTKAGETFRATVCISPAGALSLAPGTKATF